MVESRRSYQNHPSKWQTFKLLNDRKNDGEDHETTTELLPIVFKSPYAPNAILSHSSRNKRLRSPKHVLIVPTSHIEVLTAEGEDS